MKTRTIPELESKCEMYWDYGWEATMVRNTHLASRCSKALDVIEAKLERLYEQEEAKKIEFYPWR